MRALRKYVKGLQKVWLVALITSFGIGTLYFLDVTGIIESLRNDRTLDYFYQANQVLPVAPGDSITLSRHSYNKRTSQLEISNQKLNRIINDLTVKTLQGNKIPKIIHQIWDSYDVPKTFVDNMKTWLSVNPTWEYWFWTQRAVECMISKHFPQKFSLLYTEYPDATSKADAARYFILFKYGGFYVDLDAKCLKPLDVWSENFYCLLSEEPKEHSHLVRQQNHTSVVNSPLACVPHHPFYTSLLSNLTYYAGKYFGDYLHSTGPFFVEAVSNDYLKQQDKSQVETVVEIIPAKYFLPRYDSTQGEIILSKCDIRHYQKLPRLEREVCAEQIKKSYKNEPSQDSFMDHSWFHVSMLPTEWKKQNTISLFDIFPVARNLETRFCS